jgi:hypothetical protein
LKASDGSITPPVNHFGDNCVNDVESSAASIVGLEVNQVLTAKRVLPNDSFEGHDAGSPATKITKKAES